MRCVCVWPVGLLDAGIFRFLHSNSLFSRWSSPVSLVSSSTVQVLCWKIEQMWTHTHIYGVYLSVQIDMQQIYPEVWTAVCVCERERSSWSYSIWSDAGIFCGLLSVGLSWCCSCCAPMDYSRVSQFLETAELKTINTLVLAFSPTSFRLTKGPDQVKSILNDL